MTDINKTSKDSAVASAICKVTTPLNQGRKWVLCRMNGQFSVWKDVDPSEDDVKASGPLPDDITSLTQDDWNTLYRFADKKRRIDTVYNNAGQYLGAGILYHLDAKGNVVDNPKSATSAATINSDDCTWHKNDETKKTEVFMGTVAGGDTVPGPTLPRPKPKSQPQSQRTYVCMTQREFDLTH